MSVVSAVAVLAVGAQASLIAYDGFEYTGGENLGGQSGGTGWSTAWTAATSLKISSPGLTSGVLPTTGLAVSGPTAFAEVKREFAPVTGRVWMSALVRFNTLPSGSFFEFKMFEPGNVNRAAQFGFNGNSNKLFTNHDFGGALRETDFTPVTGETYRFVFTYASNGAAPTALYINPTLGALTPESPLASVTFSGNNWGLNSIGGFRLFADRANISLDEVRVGTTYGDVAPVPEPATLTAMFVGLAALARRRRR